MRIIPLMLLLALTSGACASSPAAAVVAAHRDAAALPVQSRLHVRYLSLHAIPADRRKEFLQTLNFHVNGLSREAELALVRPIGPDLVALQWPDYGWEPGVWERLAGADPYFHQKIKLASDTVLRTVWPGGKQAGEEFAPGIYREPRKAGSLVDAAAPWLPAREIEELRHWTLSEAPVLRADWFLVQTSIQKDRVAGYYDWLGLGTKEADFDRLIGANQKESRRLKREVAAIIARSGVTIRNRSILRLQSITGGYWITQDFQKSVDRQNVIRLLDGDLDPPGGDASERYGVLPNGLFAFWLQDGKGVRQDAAPDFIASDHQTAGNDRRIHIGKNCITCHLEGLRPLDDYARKLYRGEIKLTTPDYARYLRLRQLYLSDLEGWLARDRQDYSTALARVTGGMKPAELARAYSRSWDNYVEVDLLPADLARELGVQEKTLVATFKAYAQAKGSIDPVLAAVIQTPPLPVLRDHWEEVYPVAQEILLGAKR